MEHVDRQFRRARVAQAGRSRPAQRFYNYMQRLSVAEQRWVQRLLESGVAPPADMPRHVRRAYHAGAEASCATV